MKDDRLYLVHIEECLNRITAYTEEGRGDFLRSAKTQDAVIRNLEVIGEATKQLSSSLTTSYPDIPWRRIAGMRDVLIHDYMGVDLDRVWNVVDHEVPLLKQQIAEILRDLQV